MVTYPKEWDVVALGTKCEITSSKRVFESEWSKHGIPFLRTRDIASFHAGEEQKDKLYISEETYREKTAVSGEPHKGDLLVTGVGTIGLPYLVPSDDNMYFKDGNILWVKKSDDFVPEYLYLQFLSKEIIEQIRGGSGFTTVGTFTIKSAKKLMMPMPKTKEQKAIADTLEVFDSHIANLSELIEKKKAIRDGALEDLMSGRTRLAGFHKEWVPIPFEEYFTLIKNNTYSREQLSEYGSVGNIHYGDILVKFGNIVSDKDEVPRLKDGVVYSEKWLLQEKDVLIADTAEDETVGKAIQIGTMSYPVVGGLHTIVCRPNVQTATGFLGFYINSKSFHDQLLPHITGIKVSSVSKKSIKTTELLIPSDVEEQEAITDVLVSMDDEIKNLEGERNKMIQIREGAMDDLLTGRVRLPIQGGYVNVR